jgi:GDPmannose 4,6-dehydratase
MGMQDTVYLGNLDSQRDWGHAKDYVRMMWMILQAEEAEDWVIATGVTTTVRDFVKKAFQETGLEISFKGEGVKEQGFISDINEDLFKERVGENYLVNMKEHLIKPTANSNQPKAAVAVDPRYFRPTEVDLLIGDATKAKEKLGWVPKYDLAYLVKDMMQSDLHLMKKDAYLKEGGYKTMNYFE